MTPEPIEVLEKMEGDSNKSDESVPSSDLVASVDGKLPGKDGDLGSNTKVITQSHTNNFTQIVL